MEFITKRKVKGKITKKKVEKFLAQFSPLGTRAISGFLWYKAEAINVMKKLFDAADDEDKEAIAVLMEAIIADLEVFEEAFSLALVDETDESLEEHADPSAFMFGVDQGHIALIVANNKHKEMVLSMSGKGRDIPLEAILSLQSFLENTNNEMINLLSGLENDENYPYLP